MYVRSPTHAAGDIESLLTGIDKHANISIDAGADADERKSAKVCKLNSDSNLSVKARSYDVERRNEIKKVFTTIFSIKIVIYRFTILLNIL